MKQYVVIGNGVASVGCIEGIRKVDQTAKIIVVSGENHSVYSRPLISYYLEGKTDKERMKYRPETFYADNGCEVVYGKQAVRLDTDRKEVLLEDGTALAYDAVCVATGSSPFVPPFEGLDTVKKKYTFMTLDDTLALENAITEIPQAKVLIVGAGLIGLKCAEGLCHRVGEITVCDLADRVLSSILDAECASMMQKQMENHGVRFLLSDSATGFSGNTAFMKSGKQVEFDVLVLAVGVRPNVSLVKDAGGAVVRGITVNDRMETTLSAVYSAGDCTESHDISCDQNRILAILPNAYLQGKCAGVNMAGGTESFDQAIPMNSIGFFGLHAMTAGSYFDAQSGGEMYEEKEDSKIKRLFTKDGYLTGYILIGDVARAGIYTSLIRQKTPLNTLDFENVKRSPSLLAFCEDYRRKKLGGVV